LALLLFTKLVTIPELAGDTRLVVRCHVHEGSPFPRGRHESVDEPARKAVSVRFSDVKLVDHAFLLRITLRLSSEVRLFTVTVVLNQIVDGMHGASKALVNPK
jgi:hypothetical protein